MLPGWWGGMDYALFWRKERYYPALVTTSVAGTEQDNAGVLGLSTTSILFGDDRVGHSPVSGLHADIGVWMTRTIGFGTSVFSTGNEKKGFTVSSNSSGSPILARPFFNVVSAAQDAELLSFPTVSGNGGVDIQTANRAWGIDLFARYRRPGTRHMEFDLLAGGMFTQLFDNFDLSSRTTVSSVQTLRTDMFHCRNNYYAGLVGFDIQWFGQSIVLNVVGKVGLGNMIETVKIEGNTRTGGNTFNGGLLALPTNIGPHTRRTFETVSMLNARARYQLCRGIFASVGYDLIYWPKVALAGEQMDLNVNTSQQNGGTLSGASAPLFSLHNKDFWAQGATAGLYFIY